jgi:hypothetical protein
MKSDTDAETTTGPGREGALAVFIGIQFAGWLVLAAAHTAVGIAANIGLVCFMALTILGALCAHRILSLFELPSRDEGP